MNLWDGAKGVSSKDAISGMPEEMRVIRESQEQPPTFNITLMLGLITEEDCFRAIQDLGNAKYSLKEAVKQLAKDKERNSEKMEKAAAGLQRVDSNQRAIINDVCQRFHVIHPDIEQPTEQMLKVSQPYWDWYNSLYKKVIGHEPPVIFKKASPHVEEDSKE